MGALAIDSIEGARKRRLRVLCGRLGVSLEALLDELLALGVDLKLELEEEIALIPVKYFQISLLGTVNIVDIDESIDSSFE